MAVTVGALIVLIAAADAISGERDRGTLEALLLAPAARWTFVAGKALAALSLWAASFLVAAPYIWYLGRGTRVCGAAFVGGFVVGSLLALFAVGLGLLVSGIASSSRLSLSASLVLLLALFAPTQLPTSAQHGWFADFLWRIDPFTAGLRYLGKLVTNAHGPSQDAAWLVSPVVAAAALPVLAVMIGNRVALGAGGQT